MIIILKLLALLIVSFVIAWLVGWWIEETTFFDESEMNDIGEARLRLIDKMFKNRRIK